MKWTSFILGLAIGLWIAVVALFLKWANPQPVEVTVSGLPTQAGSGVSSRATGLWLPSGDGEYFCTNNDHGGAIVEDHGGGIVDDHGAPIVDDRGAPIVDDHGAPIVEDNGGGEIGANAAHVAVPGPDATELGESRGFREFRCALNDHNGPVVLHTSGRVVAVAMPDDSAYECNAVNGDATVTKNGIPVEVDHGGAIVDDAGDGMGSADTFVTCMVANRDSDATTVTRAPGS
jgi:hypothetical protein